MIHKNRLYDEDKEMIPLQVDYIVRGNSRYRKLREEVLKRDKHECRSCGMSGNVVHHLVDVSVIFKANNINTIKLAMNCVSYWDINNLVTLCGFCHSQTKKKKEVIIYPVGEGLIYQIMKRRGISL